METFLKLVATDLYEKTQGKLSKTAVVFPNKRAGLFFNEYLAACSDQPIWSPSYISISELFRELSPLKAGDPIKLVCDLHKVFHECTQSKETLDDFYFWGEMLISDFDDADKNKVDTDKLFANLQDLKQIADDYTFLEPGQEEAIQQFFQNFSIEQRTQLKEKFIQIWNALGDIYKRFKALLHQQGIAYEGMLYRDVIDNLNPAELPFDTYVFVGFNVLNKVEHELFEKLNNAGKALFYWDYDVFYLNNMNHEAGEFIRRNLRDFPSELPASCFDNLNKPKEICYISSPTENGQIRFLPQWIRDNLTAPEKETAVVLCNEAMLQPVLHSLPTEVKHLNITMGFPLSQTPACSFVSTLLEVHTEGYLNGSGKYTYQQVISLLRHPYTRKLTDMALELERELTANNRFFPLPSELKRDEALELLFTHPNSNLELCRLISKALKAIAVTYKKSTGSSETFDPLYREALFKTYTLINRFCTLIENGDLEVQVSTLKRLINKVLSSASIPFHGEPAIGMQVMGVLETRNLDFRHVLLTSVNEGQLPKNGNDASFIPYNLRKAFGMTVLEHKIAVYAYYFYRLIQRAEKVTLLYNTATEGVNRGEWSRFMLQFLVEWPHVVSKFSLEAGQSPQGGHPIVVEKTPEIMKRLQSVFDVRANAKAAFSPSALNCYLDCPLKFYYRYVAGLSIPDNVSAEIDSPTFGSIFHDAAEQIYKDLTEHGKLITAENIEQLLKDEVRLQTYVDNGFKKLFFNIPESERPEYNGIQLINSAVILRYLKQLLELDKRYAPFQFMDSEQKVYENIDINTPKGIIKSRIGGIIDRIDYKDNILRIVDYKTGGETESPADIPSLFTPAPKRPHYSFQTFLYAAIVCRKQSLQVAPALLFIHKAASENYSPVIQMGAPRKPKEAVLDFRKYDAEFREKLQELLEEIFHPDIAFTQTEQEDFCVYCDYKRLCKK